MKFASLGKFVLAAALIGAGLEAAPAQEPSNSDRVNARIVATELRDMGFSAEIGRDDAGGPRVNTEVDGFKWVIFFYTCDEGDDLETRWCASAQFFSGYIMRRAVSAATMNRWNTENRYARGYNYTTKDGKPNARVEIDVLFDGTGGNPARTFRAYFDLMRRQTEEFRKHIGFND